MAIQLEFLNWEQPLLISASKKLLEQYKSDGFLDLRELILVFQGKRSLRRFIELIVIACEAEQLKFVPPKTVTIGEIPELFYLSQVSAGGSDVNFLVPDFSQAYIWSQALKQIDKEELKSLTPILPADTASSFWLKLAETIKSLYVELAGANLSFQDLKSYIEQDSIDESKRWYVLSLVEKYYLDFLAKNGLSDIHQERKKHLNQIKENKHKIILIGVSDLNSIAKSYLAAGAALSKSLALPVIDAWVSAPASYHEYFDSFGCLNTDKWLEHQIPVKDDNIIVSSTTSEEFENLLEYLAENAGMYSPEEIVVGLANEKSANLLHEKLAASNVPYRSNFTQSLKDSELGLFLSSFVAVLHSASFSNYAALVRLPIFNSYLLWRLKKEYEISGKDFPIHLSIESIFDSFQQEFAAYSFRAKPDSSTLVGSIYEYIKQFSKLFNKKTANISYWVQAISQVIDEVFSLGLEDEIKEKLQNIFDQLLLLKDFSLSSSEFFHIFLNLVNNEKKDLLTEQGVIEIVGWLELAHDDTKMALVTNFAEGFVPESVNSDPFLPNSIRSKLGLLDNSRRYARDAFILSNLINTHSDVKLFYSCRDESGERQLPSRLLLSVAENTLGQRLQNLLNPQTRIIYTKSESGSSFAEKVKFPIKPNEVKINIDSLAVTGFKTYLTCPYTFYLQRVLRLTSIADDTKELDAIKFGSLVHDVLEKFMKLETISGDKGLKTIEELLQHITERKYAKLAYPAVYLQIEQIKHRLRQFLFWQEAWSRDSWVTKYTEYSFAPAQIQMSLKNGSIGVHGRIDRIDYNTKENLWAVFDYKVVEKSNTAESMHCNSKGYQDLQLPLYYYLLKESGFLAQHGITDNIKFAYILLAADREELVVSWLDWDSDRFKDAEKKAKEVAENILAGVFWPPAKQAKFFTEYSSIL